MLKIYTWQFLFSLLSLILAIISAPKPQWGQPCSTDTKRFVLATDFIIDSSSKGLRDLKLRISHSIPSPAKTFAASNDISTALE